MAGRKLSRQQQRRIASNQKNKRLEQSCPANKNTTQTARVISHHGRKLVAETVSGTRINCSIRQNLGDIVCGDCIVIEEPGNQKTQTGYVVVAIQPRQNLLQKTGFGGMIKPIAANIDQVIIVSSVYPEPDTRLIDRYLVAIESLPATAIIVLNKTDLHEATTKMISTGIHSMYKQIGYRVIFTSVKEQNGLDLLYQQLANQTSILVGLSGVGKSSLVKNILPEENIRIGETSVGSGEGKHTTTVASLYQLNNNGIIIDSPGVRDFTPGDISTQDIIYGFPEIRQYANQCKFSNCSHQNEPGCAVLVALKADKINPQRYRSYQWMMNDHIH